MPSLPPYSISVLLRPKLPPDTSSLPPGCEKPLLVRRASAPPRVLRPKAGLEPGIRSMPAIAELGIRSQFTVSPKGSLTRTPST